MSAMNVKNVGNSIIFNATLEIQTLKTVWLSPWGSEYPLIRGSSSEHRPAVVFRRIFFRKGVAHTPKCITSFTRSETPMITGGEITERVVQGESQMIDRNMDTRYDG